jgi:hypothetical protein
MNHTARHETKYRQADHKLVTSLHPISYRPSGMLIHRQNSYAPLGRRCTGRREVQSRELVNKVKKKQTSYIFWYGLRVSKRFAKFSFSFPICLHQ